MVLPKQLILAAINLAVVGLSGLLGKSPEDVAKDCSIRELIIFVSSQQESEAGDDN